MISINVKLFYYYRYGQTFEDLIKVYNRTTEAGIPWVINSKLKLIIISNFTFMEIIFFNPSSLTTIYLIIFTDIQKMYDCTIVLYYSSTVHVC